MAQVQLPNSTFLDYTSYGMTDATSVAAAYGLSLPATPAWQTINVAITLPRVNDPTALLQSDWATRQTTLKALGDAGTLWSTYGASQTDFNAAVATLQSMSIPVLGLTGDDGYISSAASRTIWMQLTPAHFHLLFGTPAYQSASLQDYGLYYWHNSLSLPDTIHATGVWFDTTPIWGQYPATSDQSGGAVITPAQGPQSIGNALSPLSQDGDYRESNVSAGDIADWYYNFPLTDQTIPTKTIGLVEPGIGAALPPSFTRSFQELYDAFRREVGITTSGEYYLVAPNGQNYFLGNAGERSLDMGVVASATPGSRIGLYAGSGFNNHANSSSYTAFQQAFWDEANNPSVVSSSFSIFQQSAPGSPFAVAAHELFVDAALRNITVSFADNDWGSSWNFGNGLANVANNSSSPYALIIGGTSLTTLEAAPRDHTVSGTTDTAGSLYGLAMAGDRATLWRLMESGLNVLPSSVSVEDAPKVALLESVWNTYTVTGSRLYPIMGSDVAAGDGGVDTSQATPWYQTAYGLTPTSVNPGHATGRGTPDVSANAGGNMFYITPTANMTGISWDDGTSAAAPLWASLIAQIDTVFADQGLPDLGFANDLLYQASAIAPAAFNDVTYGNNVSSFLYGGSLATGTYSVTLTGYGYYAAPGYDLTSGLGSPNGTLLARALTAIAHEQMAAHLPSGDRPDMLTSTGGGLWTSGADQSLLYQAMASDDAGISVLGGGQATSFHSGSADLYAWTSRLAQQSLQPDFDAALVRLFDGAAQGHVAQAQVHAGDALLVAVNAGLASAPQASLTGAFGFADFITDDAAVHVARPVAVAETAGGADDQTAVVRLRQNGADDVSITFYRVDTLSGSIEGLAPGSAGYAEKAEGRAYATVSGATHIDGPGYGAYADTLITHVDAGDIIAMRLTNETSGHIFWGFAQANESVSGSAVGHLWNYGLNTWGFEDIYGGGDRDYNDLIVQLDFTSSSGHGWLA
ncbi:hypothetical protein GCM10007301_57010 [Azorhizobium oxalatiphilum]|uniref:Peptidase S53 domain-containing protein n=1 Tax=Azorhizobium oxalatiphilum TaxID=980631 RepID=A0A917CKP4_9HYPH|nr:DUF4114 domain-containing protein [Azorhizobium oxalatiphilum]GGF89707.1 hypothetical protein GCM10007301_57010 [Azorhizobium oxalatiphilum]